MEESLGAQYAVQIAVHTLRDRCKSLQQRIAILEDENINLRIACSRNEEAVNSLSELDKLRVQIAELNEQRDQLHDKIKMVTNENQDLWNKLGKLINVNKNLGKQLNKINETVTQHTTPQHAALIRSKTFTQDEPQTRILQKNLELNEKISLELENVSLKLTDSFSKQKLEFEKICSEIAEWQNTDVVSEHFGFCFEDNLEDDLYDEFKYILEDVYILKSEVIGQKQVLERNLRNLEHLKMKDFPRCKTCDAKNNCGIDKCTWTDMPRLGIDKSTYTTPALKDEQSKSPGQRFPPNVEKICPVCSRAFRKDVEFPEFQQHVEDHFQLDDTACEAL